nr:hypothetical protein [Tanacetum cinerariifolium]
MAVRTNQMDPAVAAVVMVVMLLWRGDDGSHGVNRPAVRRGGGADVVGRPRWWWVAARDEDWGGGSYRSGDGECFWGS